MTIKKTGAPERLSGPRAEHVLDLVEQLPASRRDTLLRFLARDDLEEMDPFDFARGIALALGQTPEQAEDFARRRKI
jgi:hypothetical protein